MTTYFKWIGILLLSAGLGACDQNDSTSIGDAQESAQEAVTEAEEVEAASGGLMHDTMDAANDATGGMIDDAQEAAGEAFDNVKDKAMSAAKDAAGDAMDSAMGGAADNAMGSAKEAAGGLMDDPAGSLKDLVSEGDLEVPEGLR